MDMKDKIQSLLEDMEDKLYKIYNTLEDTEFVESTRYNALIEILQNEFTREQQLELEVRYGVQIR